MQNSKIEETIIFFPLMQLKQSYSLQYGKIGPLSELHNDHPTLKKLALALKLTIIDGEQLDDPVVALSVSDHKKFIGEIECLAFLACSEKEALAEDEIFSQKTMFTVTRNNGVEFICLNRNACFSVDRIEALRFQDFPTQYIRWDHEKIAEFETFLKRALKSELYRAIIECISDSKDKETKREKDRITIALMLYNQACINYLSRLPYPIYSMGP